MPGAEETRDLVPSFKAVVNGSDLPSQAVADLIAVTVYQDVEAPGMFTLELVNWDAASCQVTWSDDDLFAEGNEVRIDMGYVDHLETLIVGEITGLEPEFRAEDIPLLVVRGHDRSHRLLRGQQSRSFTQVKDSDIASQIASDRGLTAQAVDSGVTLDYVLQHNQTDLEFLRDRAWRIGYEVVVEDRALHFRPRQNDQAEVLTLAQDQDLVEFSPRLTTLTQVGRTAVRAWDPKGKAEIVAEAGVGDEATRMGGSATGAAIGDDAFGEASAAIVDRPVFTQSEADQLAAGRFNETALTYITGQGECIGRTDLLAGAVVNIEGLGQRFSGCYYVSSATHSYSPNLGYRTAFTVRRNAT